MILIYYYVQDEYMSGVPIGNVLAVVFCYLVLY